MLFNKSANLLCHFPWVNPQTMLGDNGIHISQAHQVQAKNSSIETPRFGHGIFTMDLQLVILLKNQLVLPCSSQLLGADWNMNGWFSIIYDWDVIRNPLTSSPSFFKMVNLHHQPALNDWPIKKTHDAIIVYYQINMWLSNQLFIQISVHPNDSCKYLFIQPTVLGFGCTDIYSWMIPWHFVIHP